MRHAYLPSEPDPRRPVRLLHRSSGASNSGARAVGFSEHQSMKRLGLAISAGLLASCVFVTPDPSPSSTIAPGSLRRRSHLLRSRSPSRIPASFRWSTSPPKRMDGSRSKTPRVARCSGQPTGASTGSDSRSREGRPIKSDSWIRRPVGSWVLSTTHPVATRSARERFSERLMADAPGYKCSQPGSPEGSARWAAFRS